MVLIGYQHKLAPATSLGKKQPAALLERVWLLEMALNKRKNKSEAVSDLHW